MKWVAIFDHHFSVRRCYQSPVFPTRKFWPFKDEQFIGAKWAEKPREFKSNQVNV